ncbi:50S ribosomal protein L1 [Deinococcus metallilatus]|uniref:Large ribosomal subunit protein uL1 n=1 Tax=Deinococcus metallilatus TaxID=1211322 RepID=A0AAJ5F508_9DEIO|nr:50S ribosomal protein L1 [Deinococcus metallilatus]MBB5295034.1 large subunit ribosomal protein L1 [Deinococcus metallilatus]QBY09276.1 50S ribosomal protein L1 [Deinococcus metallilatus]RXJ09281.1 50S ribosomal protein L1 [Deinococcus metallilatus]TLK28803.1 50S ribosomal protein L1 [Deinococcus metallilatus]GMA16967.1 50S ribosomal protein L1 [Deinococcus metallilatus]
MPKHGKRYRALVDKVDRNKQYTIDEAASLVKDLATAKFDETVEVHFRLGIDPRKSDQNVRGTVALPHGTGRSVRVAVITKGDNVAAAEGAGADVVGGEDLIERIAGGFMDFDAVVATPDMMAQVGQKLARLLGPRGLLPNPKSGTVGPDVAGMVRGLKAGRIEFRNDKTGVVHAPIGKASFDAGNLSANYQALLSALEAAKPGSAKGVYLRSAYLTSTMGPSIPLTLSSQAQA